MVFTQNIVIIIYLENDIFVIEQYNIQNKVIFKKKQYSLVIFCSIKNKPCYHHNYDEYYFKIHSSNYHNM